MGFLSDIVRDSRPRAIRAREGGGTEPAAEPLGVSTGLSLGARAPGFGLAPAEAGGMGRGETDPFPARRADASVPPPAIEREDRQRRRRVGRELRASARGPEDPTTPPSPEGAEDGKIAPEPTGGSPEARAPAYGGAPAEVDELSHADTGVSPEQIAEDSVPSRADAEQADAGAPRQRQGPAVVEPPASVRGLPPRVRTFRDPSIRDPAAEVPSRDPGDRSAPVEAGGEERPEGSLGSGAPGRAADAASSPAPMPDAPMSDAPMSDAPMSEPPVPSSTVGDEHGEGRRRVQIQPHPEGAEDARDSRDPAPQTGAEGPRERDVAETVARPVTHPVAGPAGLSEASSGNFSFDPRTMDAPGSRRVHPFPRTREPRRDSQRAMATARPGGATVGSGEGEIPVVEAVARPAAPPRALPPVREREAGPGTHRRPSREPEGPRVHIGQVDVTIQAPPERRTAPKPERQPTGLTSRLYLRRL